MTLIALIIAALISGASSFLLIAFFSAVLPQSLPAWSQVISGLVTVHLLGLGLGSWLFGWCTRTMGSKFFLRVQWALFFTLLVTLVWYFLHPTVALRSSQIAVVYGFLLFLLSVLVGVDLPFFLSWSSDRDRQIVSAHFLGGVVGFLLFLLFSHVYWGPQSLLLAVLVGSLVLTIIFCRSEKWPFLFLFVGQIIIFIFMVNISGSFAQIRLKSHYYFKLPENHRNFGEYLNLLRLMPTITSFTTPMQIIDIVPKHMPRDGNFRLYLNSHYQYDSGDLLRYHKDIVVPIYIFHEPVDILILGGGDGVAADHLLKSGLAKSITIVEIDPMMLNLADNNFMLRFVNQGSLANAKVVKVKDDAFVWVRNQKQKFDFILADFPIPDHVDLSRLYSVEFLKRVQTLLQPNGCFVTDFPVQQMNEGALKNKHNDEYLARVSKAFAEAFPKGSNWYYGTEDSFILNCQNLNDQQIHELVEQKSYEKLKPRRMEFHTSQSEPNSVLDLGYIQPN